MKEQVERRWEKEARKCDRLSRREVERLKEEKKEKKEKRVESSGMRSVQSDLVEEGKRKEKLQ